jgi:hypothetical protein
MHVLCPNCQQAITVPEESAGQTAQCPLCGGTFTAPTLFTPPTRPADPPRSEPYALAPTAPTPAAPPTSTATTAADPGRTATAPVTAPTAPLPPSTEPPAGLTHTATLVVREPVVRGLALGALALAVVLTFFSWNGAYPGNYGVYTQGPWGALFKNFSVDLVGEKVLTERAKAQQPAPPPPADGTKPAGSERPPSRQAELRDVMRPSWWMLPYLLGLLAMVALAVIELVLPRLNRPMPQALARFHQQPPSTRLAILAGLAGITLISLLAQCLSGFGLENAIAATVEKDPELAKLGDPAITPEERQRLEMLKAEKMGQFSPTRRLWFDLAVLAHLIILVGVGLEYWLYRRGERPAPRLELHW